MRALALLLLAACADPVHWVPLPSAAGARSLVLGVEQGERFEAHAVDLDRPAAVSIPAEGASVDAILYAEPLGTLRLEPGRIAPPAPPAGRLGEGLARYRWAAAADALDEARWVSIPSVSPRLAELPVPLVTPPCPDFDFRLHTFGGKASVRFVLRADATSAIVGSGDHRYARVGYDGVRPLSVVGAGTATISAGFRSEDGRYWFGAGGALFSGSLGDDLLRVSLLAFVPTGGSIESISGGPTDEGFELFLVTHFGVVYRYLGGRFTELVRLGTRAGGEGGVAWAEPGVAYVGWPTETSVLRYAQGRLSSESIPSPASVTAVGVVPGIGPIALTALGDVLLREAGAWRLIGGGRFGLFLYAVAPYADGFFVGGAIGLLQLWTPSRGFCSYEGRNQKPLGHLAILDDGVLVGSGGSPGSNLETAVLVMKPGP